MPNNANELVECCAQVLRTTGWRIRRNYPLSDSPKGGSLRADIMATSEILHKRIAVYPRWQATSGTAEEKLPFQLIKVQIAAELRPDILAAAYFVLEGNGWSWREYYLSNDLNRHLRISLPVHCVSLSELENRAANGQL